MSLKKATHGMPRMIISVVKHRTVILQLGAHQENNLRSALVMGHVPSSRLAVSGRSIGSIPLRRRPGRRTLRCKGNVEKVLSIRPPLHPHPRI